MKRLFPLILVLVFIAVMFGCSAPKPSDVTKPTQKPSEATSEPAVEEPTAEPAVEEPTDEPAPAGTAYEVTYTNAIVYKNSIGSVWVHAIVQLENTGTDPLYLSSSTIDLEDADEHLVKTLDLVSAYPEVLLPGETALLVEDTTLDEDPGVDT